MDSALTRFFGKEKQTEILRRFQTDLLMYQAGVPSVNPFNDFLGPSILAEYAYVCGDYATALTLLQQASAAGHPLVSDLAEAFPESRVSQAGVLIDLGKNAFLAGLNAVSREAFLRAYDLAPSEGELTKRQGEASIYRHYAAVAVGLDVTTFPLKGSGHGWQTWMIPLSRAISALIQFRQGQIGRTEATQALFELISRTNGEDNQRVAAISHALYLQTAFPEAFDPVLPPLAE